MHRPSIKKSLTQPCPFLAHWLEIAGNNRVDKLLKKFVTYSLFHLCMRIIIL